MKFKKGLAIIGIISSLAMGVQGQVVTKLMDQLFRESIVMPIKYDKKIYIKGNYYEDDTAYKIEKIDGKYYMPLRLGMTALQNNVEGDWWQLNVGTTEPMKIDLVSYIGNRHNGGWSNTGEVKTAMQLTVGSQTALKNKTEVVLPHAPQKINGQVCLSLETFEELFDLAISEESGLLFIGKEEVKAETEEDRSVIKQITQGLKMERKKENIKKEIRNTVCTGGKTYYLADEYDAKAEEWQSKLWVRTEEGKERVIQLPEGAKITQEASHLTSERLYYTLTTGENTYLCAVDLKKEQSIKLANLTQTAQWSTTDWGWLGPIYEANGNIYVTLHWGDYTMGAESLYEVSKGTVKEIVSGKFFTDIVFTEDKLYYTESDNWGSPNNLYELDLTTLQKKGVGVEDYQYSEITYKAGSLYVIARKVEKEGEIEIYQDECLYRLDLENSEQSKLTLHTHQYWIEDRVYYVDEGTGYLIGIDLDGENKKTILSKPMRQIEKQGNKFYYLLQGYVPGVFKYDLTKGTTQTVMPQYTDQIIVFEDTVLAISGGYNPGIFKVENGKTVQKVKGIIEQPINNSTNMMYTLYEDGKLYYIQ